MPAKNIPFDFIVDNITAGRITTKFMFGMLYIYQAGRIMLMLRQRENEPELNGVWIAVDKANHETLMRELPPAAPYTEFGPSNKWLLLPDTAKDFEHAALQLCRLINRGDKRIGRTVPGSRSRKVKVSKT